MTEPGWYQDDNGDTRYWDGQAWTDQVQPATPAYIRPASLSQPAAPASAKTNTMAIVALVSAFILSPLGVIFGFISLSQIKRTGESGRGLAIAGIVIGVVSMVLSGLFLAMAVASFSAFSGQVDETAARAEAEYQASIIQANAALESVVPDYSSVLAVSGDVSCTAVGLSNTEIAGGFTVVCN